MQEAARRRWAAAKPDQPGGPGGPKSDLVDGGGSKKGPRGACNVPRPHWECTAIKRIKMAKGATLIRPRPMRLTLPKALVMSAPLPASTDACSTLAWPTRRGSMARSCPFLGTRQLPCCFARPLGLPWAIDICIEFQPALVPSLLPVMVPLLCRTAL